MMYFGWRTPADCYQGQGPQQTANCESPTWWYVLMGAAAIAGFAMRKKRA